MNSASDTRLVAASFVRGLGLVFVLAFFSLMSQAIGLYGAEGIHPIVDYLTLAHARYGALGVLRIPTWLWLVDPTDNTLLVLCLCGIACSVAVLAGRLPRIALFGAWSCYLSFCSVGQPFLSYQWDNLLLETGIVGLFVATPGSSLGIWLARALCCKLMLLSGIVKLASHDPTWRDLSAMSFHFWTQPLPAWPAALADALPNSVKSGMTFATLAIELVAPLAIFAPRRARLIAAAALTGLQLVIGATGTYGFFNLLALLLCAALLDDDALLALCPARWRQELATSRRTAPSLRAPRLRRALFSGSAAVLLTLSALSALERMLPLPSIADQIMATIAPLRSVNSYGLFAVMTTERREIALEGSSDGVYWKRYEFRWKPGPLDRRPRFATPHMPRLDWQMWFAALGSCERQVWLQTFLRRILEGQHDVLELLAENPFPRTPPRYLRTPLAQYRFAPNAGFLHGRWWVSEPIGEYCPRVELQDGKLARVPVM